MDIVKEKIGEQGDVSVSLNQGKLLVAADYQTPIGKASAAIEVDADKVIDLIAAKIPGQVDDAIFAVMKAALKNV